jgi:hypothetical protein
MITPTTGLAPVARFFVVLAIFSQAIMSGMS